MNEFEFFATFKKPKADIEHIEELIKAYGENATLKDIHKKVSESSVYRNLPHKCPKCDGRGYIIREYNGYPSGLPDSGFVYEPAYDYSVCDVCDGLGWTKTKRKPIVETKIVGYE